MQDQFVTCMFIHVSSSMFIHKFTFMFIHKLIKIRFIFDLVFSSCSEMLSQCCPVGLSCYVGPSAIPRKFPAILGTESLFLMPEIQQLGGWTHIMSALSATCVLVSVCVVSHLFQCNLSTNPCHLC